MFDDSQYLHGECALPDGNLLTIDAMIRRGMFCAIRIGGNNVPASAATLEAVNAALLNLPMYTDREQLADTVRGALGPDAMLEALSTEGLATAIWHALQQGIAA